MAAAGGSARPSRAAPRVCPIGCKVPFREPEKPRELLVDRRLGHAADALLPENAVGVDEEVRRDAHDAVGRGDAAVGVEHHGEGQAGSLDVLADGGRVFAEVDGEYDEPGILVFEVGCLDVGVFGAAGRGTTWPRR